MIALFLTGSHQALKNLANAIALILVAPCAGMAVLEGRLSARRDAIFNFWTHLFALAPGLPGMYLRRAFYRMTLDECAIDCFVGFGTIFTHRQARVEPGVYIGPYGLVGGATLRRGCLVGSRVSIVSGRNLHELQPDGTWGPSRIEALQPLEIGEHCWIGEASTILANVGRGALVGAGSVVAAAVPPGVMVAGNPARFIRVLQPPARPAAQVEKMYAGRVRSGD